MKKGTLILTVLCMSFLIFSCSKKDKTEPKTKPKYTISVSTDPSVGGTVERSDAGPSYEEGTTVTLTAKAATGYEFVKWSGDVSGTDPSLDITMDNDYSVTAEFKKAKVHLSMTSNNKMEYNKTSFTVEAGEEITLSLENIGDLPAAAMSHDVVILRPGTSTKDFGLAATLAGGVLDNLSNDLKSRIVAHTDLLGPGESDEITFVLDDPGEYPILCAFPGHFDSEQGVIIVK